MVTDLDDIACLDDEEDWLYLLYCDQRGKWQVAESVNTMK